MRRLQAYISFVLVLLGVFTMWLLPRKIIIKEITCKSQNGVCSESIQRITERFTGKSLSTSENGIKQTLSGSLAHDVTFRYQYPSVLVVSVIETKPEFALSNKEQNDFRLVDVTGNVLAHSQTTDLPYISMKSDLPEVGSTLSEKNLFALKLLSDLAKNYQLSYGELTDASLVIELPTKTKVLFPLEGDRELILGSFVMVINQLNSVKTGSTMEKGLLSGKTVDFRFKNPVIR